MNTLSESEIALVIGEATELFKHVAILADGRSGCYLCLGDKKTGAPMLIVRFGDILLPEKASAYLNNAQEKCRRVVQTKTDLASETKLEKERYAGAVRGDSAIYGVSGYPEYLDEAAMLILAVRCADLGPMAARNLADKSKNSYFQRLWNLAMPPRSLFNKT